MSSIGERPRAFIQEVALRDGLQNEACFVPTPDKIALIDALSRTGLAKIEVTSFTSPKAIPALADAEAVMAGIARVQGVCYSALVPNVRGAERAVACSVDEFNLVMSVSETHNLTNLHMTREQSFAHLADAIGLAKQVGIATNVSLSCVFGCPMEGNIDPRVSLGWASRFVDLGVRGITLCDTTGMAYPALVSSITEQFNARWPDIALTLHFHNTRGMGLANVLAATQSGARRFDAALGGIGGCPYAPGATGNVCTEDMVHMLDLNGCETGIDIAALVTCASRLPELVGHEVPGQLLRAGPRLRLHAVPASLDSIRARLAARKGDRGS
jgi:hydroxymethylglutaryl-CoA lyase